jgi:DNA polymerase zeta
LKILEKSLRVLFETKDVTKVRLFVQRQFTKIIENRASLQDLTFAKEFRGLGGYRPGAVVPALELTRFPSLQACSSNSITWTLRRLMKHDRRAIPRSGERVPYLIVFGEPGRPLIQSVRAPEEVLRDSSLRPNSTYYVTRVIVPPLNRCFSLVGVDVMSW